MRILKAEEEKVPLMLFEVIDNVMQFIVEPGDWLLMRQRYHQASTCVPTHEGDCYYQIGSGALPGDKIGADFFRLVFQRAIREWVSKDKCKMLCLACPITKEVVNVGKSAYADDLCSKHVYNNTPTPCEIQDKQTKWDEVLDECIVSMGLKQNKQKNRCDSCGVWQGGHQHCQGG